MPNSQTADGFGSNSDAHGFGKGVEMLKSDVANLGRGVADAARTATSEFGHGAKHAVDAAKDKLVEVKDMARDHYEGAKEAAGDAADSVKDAIARNPLASVGIAAGVGLLLGMVLARSRS